jgi:hypothetical protein
MGEEQRRQRRRSREEFCSKGNLTSSQQGAAKFQQ